MCYVLHPGLRTGVAQPFLPCCPNTTPATLTNTPTAYSWYGSYHHLLWVFHGREIFYSNWIKHVKKNLVVVVVGVSLTGHLCGSSFLLSAWFSIHDVQKCLFIHWVKGQVWLYFKLMPPDWSLLSFLGSFHSVKGESSLMSLSLCLSRLSFAPLPASLSLSVSTASCLRCVCWFVHILSVVDIRLQPCSPDTPTVCFVRIPMLLYLTFWTTQGPEIESQWHRHSPTGQTAASAVETVAVHTSYTCMRFLFAFNIKCWFGSSFVMQIWRFWEIYTLLPMVNCITGIKTGNREFGSVQVWKSAYQHL